MNSSKVLVGFSQNFTQSRTFDSEVPSNEFRRYEAFFVSDNATVDEAFVVIMKMIIELFKRTKGMVYRAYPLCYIDESLRGDLVKDYATVHIFFDRRDNKFRNDIYFDLRFKFSVAEELELAKKLVATGIFDYLCENRMVPESIDKLLEEFINTQFSQNVTVFMQPWDPQRTFCVK